MNTRSAMSGAGDLPRRVDVPSGLTMAATETARLDQKGLGDSRREAHRAVINLLDRLVNGLEHLNQREKTLTKGQRAWVASRLDELPTDVVADFEAKTLHGMRIGSWVRRPNTSVQELLDAVFEITKSALRRSNESRGVEIHDDADGPPAWQRPLLESSPSLRQPEWGKVHDQAERVLGAPLSPAETEMLRLTVAVVTAKGQRLSLLNARPEQTDVATFHETLSQWNAVGLFAELRRTNCLDAWSANRLDKAITAIEASMREGDQSAAPPAPNAFGADPTPTLTNGQGSGDAAHIS